MRTLSDSPKATQMGCGRAGLLSRTESPALNHSARGRQGQGLTPSPLLPPSPRSPSDSHSSQGPRPDQGSPTPLREPGRHQSRRSHLGSPGTEELGSRDAGARVRDGGGVPDDEQRAVPQACWRPCPGRGRSLPPEGFPEEVPIRAPEQE